MQSSHAPTRPSRLPAALTGMHKRLSKLAILILTVCSNVQILQAFCCLQIFPKGRVLIMAMSSLQPPSMQVNAILFLDGVGHLL